MNDNKQALADDLAARLQQRNADRKAGEVANARDYATPKAAPAKKAAAKKKR